MRSINTTTPLPTSTKETENSARFLANIYGKQ